MRNSIQRVGLAWLCLWAWASIQTLGGAEPAPVRSPAATTTPKTVPAQLNGTVLAVNPRARTIIVDVQGRNKLLTVNVTKTLRILRDGKIIGFEQLAVGQTVNLAFVEFANGQIEVASVTVTANPEALQAAGHDDRGWRNHRRNLPPQAPFNTPPNPANVGGPRVSKHCDEDDD